MGLVAYPLVIAMTKTAILFPGQGAQTPGMGKDFSAACPESAALFAEANDILGYDLRALCFEGPSETLTLTTHAQPAIYVTSAAVTAALRSAGKLDDVVAAAGLSLGEYTALWFAGAFSFADGLRLVKKRGAAMQAASDAPPSGMVSLVGADRDAAEKTAAAARGDGVLVVANLNAPGQIVLSGDKEACARVPEAAKAFGIRRAIPLQVAGAFHSPLMEPARAALVEALDATPMHDLRIPVVSNVTGKAVTTAADARALLARQVVAPVLWEDSMKELGAMGIRRFIEPAPGAVLTALLRKNLTDIEASNFGTLVDLTGGASA